MVRIDQMMSRPVVTCRIGDPLDTVASLMWNHDCGIVPVVDAQERLVGVVTDRDICMAAYTQGRRLGEIPVDVAMSRTVFTCRPDDPISRAEELMAAYQVRRIPIVDRDDHPIGVLSLNDVARDSTRAGASQHGLLYGLARTLAAICRPRGAPIDRRRAAHSGETHAYGGAP